MDSHLTEVLDGREENYLLPFLWMHDGHHDELPALVDAVYQSGARAFCVESRPHEHFCEQEWWDDMDVVLSEAEKRGMKVWILDDKHFPTGYANGEIVARHPDKRKWHLIEEHLDVVGPARDNALLIRTEPSEEEILLGVFAYPLMEKGDRIAGKGIDLTSHVRGRYVFWDIPEGVYRVFYLYKSRRGANYPKYIHMIDPDSVRVLIDAVYEPHYSHYARYFGNTIAGFFSDEPSLGNKQLGKGCTMYGMYDQQLGLPGIALPWTDEVLAIMEKELGTACLSLLPALWYRMDEGKPAVRVAYMNAITHLWEINFSWQIGDWCRAHGVEYIGHIIEDMNAHARLGCSAGHYFRALSGQNMAGIDVVLHQIMPGMAHYDHAAVCPGGHADSVFFDYVLARLAASLSHFTPRMRDRAMCEVFGAYGWAEHVPMMKYLMDHMLVRGINRFVPHAFSPKFPDPDSPPHFWADGMNPQFEAFSRLMRYTNRCVHLMEGMREKVSAAILYHAEAEWAGEGAMFTQCVARELYDSQLNYDILPIDCLMADADIRDGNLTVNGMAYPVLLIPESGYLPPCFTERLAELAGKGLDYAYINARPRDVTEGRVIRLDEAADYVSQRARDVSVSQPFPFLRFRHVTAGSQHAVMLVNECMTGAFDGTVLLPFTGEAVRADLQLERFTRVSLPEGKIHLHLACGQSVMLLSGMEAAGCPEWQEMTEGKQINCSWQLSVRKYNETEYGEPVSVPCLYNLTGPEGDPDFSGTMRYETVFDANGTERLLDLGCVGDTAHVYLNGQDLGIRFGLPYQYDIEGFVRKGENELRVETANTLVHQLRDRYSTFMQISPSGLLGPVKLG